MEERRGEQGGGGGEVKWSGGGWRGEESRVEGRHTGPHVLHMQQLNTDKGADCWVRFYLFLVFFLE